MSIEYQVIEELTIPLRDILIYEAHVNSSSETYQELVGIQSQINSSLAEIQSMVHRPHSHQFYNSSMLYVLHYHMVHSVFTKCMHIIIDIVYILCSRTVICLWSSYHFNPVKIHNQVTVPATAPRYSP